jgi:hypothetical protein
MKYYVEAYDSNDRQVLGNLDGQTVLRVRNYKRTKHYNWLRENKGRNPRVSYYRIVTNNGCVIETLNQETK